MFNSRTALLKIVPQITLGPLFLLYAKMENRSIRKEPEHQDPEKTDLMF